MSADDFSDMFSGYTLGDYISDWAEKQFGPGFSDNKFRDGSAFAPPPEKAQEDRPIRIVIEISRT